ncbi:hypothetical protein JW935_09330 [candidate division KSB1 bacterium]|nr:hypothetical protein [candidate division KSB1 bacterium]
MWTITQNLPVQIALLELVNIAVDRSKRAFERLQQCAADYHNRYQGTNISRVPGVQHARSFFRAIGIDPTKRRPSSEALLNRALKQKELYSVNSLVDTGNWCSLDFLLPICVYDADKIRGDVSLRLGQAGESYLALNNFEANLEGRFLLADTLGPFGSPITDSQRTAVNRDTRAAFLLIFAPADYETEQLKIQTETFLTRTVEMCGGECKEMVVGS